MRVLSTNTNTQVRATITTPAYFVELQYSTVLRFSSRGNQAWNGQSWIGGRLGKLSVGDSGTLEVINSDLSYSATVLNEGAADIQCKIWKFYGDNPDTLDSVPIFKGVTNGADINADRVRFKITRENSRTLFSPRRFVSPMTGFNHLRPAETKIYWNNQIFTLERNY